MRAKCLCHSSKMPNSNGAEGVEASGEGYSRALQRAIGSLEKTSRKYEATVEIEYHARVCVVYFHRNGKITAMSNQDFVEVVASSTVPAQRSKCTKTILMVAPLNLQPAHGRAQVQQPTLTVMQVSRIFLG
jgi:hypothetical protein